MKLKRNHFGQVVEPQYILTKPSGERLGVINCLTKDMSLSFNAPDEIHFTTALYMDGEKNLLYDHIAEGQFIEVTDYGRYVIVSCDASSDGTIQETKSCNAISKEVLLGQKYLELFSINMGTTESINEVQFYNQQNPTFSLLHLVLDKCPDWAIGHVDTSLMTLHRCFKETRVDIYSFLTTTVAQAFQCVFLFDSYNGRINIYSEDTVGMDTDIYVTFQNLLKNTSISSSLDNIKTCLTVTSADGLNLREVNMGYDKIYMLDYFATTEYMSQGLYDAYNAWKAKWNRCLPEYTSLLSPYQKYYEDIDYETNKKMPDKDSSTTWSEYGLVPLKEKLETYEGNLDVMMKDGWGNKEAFERLEKEEKEEKLKLYNEYLDCFNTIQAIKEQIRVEQNIIEQLKDNQADIGKKMDAIISEIDMVNNFSESQLKELSLFIREDELSSDNYVVTDIMTDTERMNVLKEMLEFGQRELRKVSQPQYQFSANLLNLCALPEFDRDAEFFNVGNYIHILLRDDYMVKARLLQIKVNFLDVKDFNVTFGTLSRLNGSNVFSDVTQAINTATSVATTVSFNASHWNKANKEATQISQMLADGLLAAGESLKTARSDVEIDERGIMVCSVSSEPTDTYNDKIFIGDGKILFSDDGMKTVKTAIGHLTYKKQGIEYTDFGVLADFVIAGYVAGSTIEGNTIIGGTITGSEFNNGDDTFSVDKDGVLSAAKGYIGRDKDGRGGFVIDANKLYSNKDSISSNKDGIYLGTDGISLGKNDTFKVDNLGNLNADSATITGNITANEGYIGGADGFVIRSQKLYSKKTSIDDSTTGIYLGTDGIALGANSVFKVTNGGVLTATSGHIGGANITNSAIRSENGNWSINSDGTAIFKNVVITGDSSSLKIGGGFEMTDTALNNFNDLVANKITAEYINATVQLTANYATIGNLELVSGRVGDLEANTVNLQNLIAQKIDAATVKTEYMEVANWTSAGKIRADRIDANTITSILSSSDYIFVNGRLSAHAMETSELTLGIGGSTKISNSARWATVTIDNISYTVLCKS